MKTIIDQVDTVDDARSTHRANDVDRASAIVVAGRDADTLSSIRAPSCALAIWRRAPRIAFPTSDIATFAPIRFEARSAEVHTVVAEHLAARRRRDWASLAADIGALARHFADIVRSAEVELRLEPVTTDACRKFHADYVSCRLISTYLGPGTEWIRAGDPDRIHRLATGDVAAFKGREWAPDRPILHRSPPIAGSGDVRLLLVIDPLRPIDP